MTTQKKFYVPPKDPEAGDLAFLPLDKDDHMSADPEAPRTCVTIINMKWYPATSSSVPGIGTWEFMILNARGVKKILVNSISLRWEKTHWVHHVD